MQINGLRTNEKELTVLLFYCLLSALLIVVLFHFVDFLTATHTWINRQHEFKWHFDGALGSSITSCYSPKLIKFALTTTSSISFQLRGRGRIPYLSHLDDKFCLWINEKKFESPNHFLEISWYNVLTFPDQNTWHPKIPPDWSFR